MPDIGRPSPQRAVARTEEEVSFHHSAFGNHHTVPVHTLSVAKANFLWSANTQYNVTRKISTVTKIVVVVRKYQVQCNEEELFLLWNYRRITEKKGSRKFINTFPRVSVTSKSTTYRVNWTNCKQHVPCYESENKHDMFFRESLGDTGVRSKIHPHPYNDYPRKMVHQSHLYTKPQNCFTWNHTNWQLCKSSRKRAVLQKVRFCNWLCESVCTSEGNVLLTSFWDHSYRAT